MSDSLQPAHPWTATLHCPSLSPRVCSNSCSLSWWCYPTISSSVVPFSPAFNFPSIRVSSNQSVLPIRWLKYWSFSFSINPSNEYSVLISFRIDWFGLFCSLRTLKSLLQHYSSKPSILLHSAFFHGPFLTSIHDSWKNHIWTFVGRLISAL